MLSCADILDTSELIRSHLGRRSGVQGESHKTQSRGLHSGDTEETGINNFTQQWHRHKEGEYRVLRKDSLAQASHKPMPAPDHVPVDAFERIHHYSSTRHWGHLLYGWWMSPQVHLYIQK